jgi:hypothetical protein
MSREREHSTTDIALALDVRKLRRAGDLGGDHKVVVRWTRGESVNSVGVTFLGGEHAFVSYRDERGEATTERIGIEWTFCNFGGERPWWTCPHCRRRCAIVYASGPSPFVCRLCASLTYETSQSDAYARANCKVNKRRERLGWERGAPSPPKPKGMHRRTWMRLVAECLAADRMESAALGTWMECMHREIGRIARRVDEEIARRDPSESFRLSQ